MILLSLNGLYLGAAYRQSQLLFWILDVSQFVVVPVLSFWILFRYGQVSPNQYGLSLPTKNADPVSALILCVFISFSFCSIYIAARFLGYVVESLWSPQAFSYGQAIPKQPLLAFYAIAYLALSAGFVEEIVYRGLPHLLLSTRVSEGKVPLVYSLSSSVLFASAHWENGSGETFATFLLGLALAALYLRVRNLWPFVIGHAFTDVLALTGKL